MTKLSEQTGLLIFDYAMKFLPVQYREKQIDWFGKKGFSWDVFSFLTCKAGDLVKPTYVVILLNFTQDALTSAALYRLVLNKIKCDFPQLQLLYDKSDNATYYCN